MADMSKWTQKEKLEYIPLLSAIIKGDKIDDSKIESDNVREAARDLMRPDR